MFYACECAWTKMLSVVVSHVANAAPNWRWQYVNYPFQCYGSVWCNIYIYIYMCVSFGYIYILHDSLVLFCFYIYLFYSHFSTDDRRTSTGSYVSVEVYFLCIYKNTFNARMTRLYVSPVCWLCWVCLIATNDLHIYIIQYTYVLHCIRGAEDCMSKISSYKYHKVSWVLAHIWATNLHAYAT